VADDLFEGLDKHIVVGVHLNHLTAISWSKMLRLYAMNTSNKY